MNFLRNHTFKETSALFFTALFVFALAVKALHSHDFSSVKNCDEHAVNISANFFCSICEFQIAKDVDANTYSCDISAPFVFIPDYYCKEVKLPVAFEKHFSIRGPPAVA